MLSLPVSLVTEVYFYLTDTWKVITTTAWVHCSVWYARAIHCLGYVNVLFKCICVFCLIFIFYSPSLQTNIWSLHCLWCRRTTDFFCPHILSASFYIIGTAQEVFITLVACAVLRRYHGLWLWLLRGLLLLLLLSSTDETWLLATLAGSSMWPSSEFALHCKIKIIQWIHASV